MRTIFWVGWASLLSYACATTPAIAPLSSVETSSVVEGGSDVQRETAAASSNSSDPPRQSVEVVTGSGKKLRITVEGDQYVRPEAGVDVQVVAEIGSSLVVVDTYLSRPGGGSYCQAGQERFLRILRLDDGAPQETVRLKLASCWQDIELADPGLQWSPNDSTLRISWLFGPTTKLKSEELTLRLVQE